MGTILITLGLILILGLIAVILINLAIYQYENQKLADLTKQIRQKNSAQILNRSNAIRAFTTFDLNASIKRSTDFAKNVYSKTVTGIQTLTHNPQESSQVNKAVQGTKQAMNTLFKGIGSILTSSSSPSKSRAPTNSATVQNDATDQDTTTIQHEREYTKDVDQLITKSTMLPVTHTQSAHSDTTSQSLIDDSGTATINLATDSGKKPGDLSAFEKMEIRILKQLKESSMANYDIWLQLADLYLKYDQKDKAKDVYALVLKHAKADIERTRARNGLIALA